MVVSAWRPLKKSAVVLYFYTPSGRTELSLNIGDQLQVEEETEGWYKGHVIKSATSTPNKSGIFPKSYVKLVETFAGSNVDTDVVLSQIHQALTEWANMLKACFKEGKMTQFHALKERMSLLLEMRRQIMSQSTLPEVREALKAKALDKVVEVRALMGQDITPRNNKGEIADESNSGIIALYHLHHQQDEITKKNNKIPALRVVRTEERAKKEHDKKTKKKMRREDMRKTVMVARAQFIGTLPEPDPETKALGADLTEQVPHHVLFDFKILMCPVGETAELYFSIYNGLKNEFISEEYLVVMTAQGMPTDISKLGKLKTIFSDLPVREWHSGELYLVLRIIKRAKSGDDKKFVKRPFGVALLHLTAKGSDPVLVPNKEAEHTFTVFAPTQESHFPTLHEHILKNNFQATKNGPLAEVPNSRGVCVALALMQGDVSKFTESGCITNRKTILDSVPPNYLRNDLYITLQSGEFVRDKIASTKSVQAVFSVHTTNGDLVNDCIYEGTGNVGLSEIESVVYSHTNTPTWEQTFWLHFPSPISLDWYADKWLFVQLYHHGDKAKEREEFSQAYLKLAKDDGPVIDDGSHTLSCYKPSPTPFPANLSQRDEAKGGLKKGESLKLKIQLTATELTSNSYIFSLLRWKLNSVGLEDVLKRFVFIEATEIVKFMKEVCSTIFEIMEAREDLSLLSFDALVFIIGLGSRVSAALDKYLATQFRAPNVYRILLKSLKHYLNQQGDPVNHSKMLSTFKSLAYIFKFIIASRAQHMKSGAQNGNDTFDKDNLDVFDLFTELMKNNSPQMRGPQSSALKNISGIFGDLQAVFTKVELSRIIARFIQSVHYSPQLELLNKEKLILINKLVCTSSLFLDVESLHILLPSVLYQIGLHLRGSHHDEILQSIVVLSVIANTFQTKVKVEELIFLVLEHITAVMSAVRTMREEVEFGDQPAICLLALLKMSSRAVFERYLKSLGDWNTQAEFLTDLFTLLHEMLSTPRGSNPQVPHTRLHPSPSSLVPPASPQPSHPSATSSPTLSRASSRVVNVNTPSSPSLLSAAMLVPVTSTPFPSHWLFINMFAYGAILKTTDYVNAYMVQMYSELNKTTKALWERVLALILVFLRARPLAMEVYSPLKKNLVLERYNDMRKPMSQILLRMWGALKPVDQISFLKDLVGPTLYLMMMEPVFVQDAGIKLYYSLVEIEVKETKAIKSVEALTIDTLDSCAYEGTLPQHFNTFFVSRLQAAFAESKSSILAQTGKKFIGDITYLLDLLADLSDLPNSLIYEDERVEAIVKLMDYLKATGRTTSYLKYVHMLESIHAVSGNFGEAGHTILLHAELMKWGEDIVDSIGVFPKESQRNRKERLYKTALDYFDKGKLWEEAIKLIKELRVEYELTLYDYQKLSEILDTQATLVKKISTIERFFPEYFRVACYGKGFDAKHQGKEYVFRGLEHENRTEFLKRMEARFTDAQIINNTDPPTEEILNSPNQHLQIFSVKPQTSEVFNPDMPQSIMKYYQLNNHGLFYYQKVMKVPFKKGMSSEENVNMWLRQNTYHTAGKLPGIRRRVEILKTDEVILTPIQNAVASVEARNVELMQFARKYESGTEDEKNLNPFTMILTGTINAAIGGGAVKYVEYFITKQYLQDYPVDEPLVRQLIAALKPHIPLLERCLVIHKRLCNPKILPLHEAMEQKFYTDLVPFVGPDKLIMPTM